MAIHNPVTSYGVNSSGDSEAVTVTAGAAHVVNGVSGTPKAVILLATLDPTDAVDHIWDDATGCKQFRVSVLEGLTTSVTGIVFAYSTDEGAFSSLDALCDLHLAGITTPDGLAREGVEALPLPTTAGMLVPPGKWISYDGTNTFKSIMVMSLGAAQGAVQIEMQV